MKDAGKNQMAPVGEKCPEVGGLPPRLRAPLPWQPVIRPGGSVDMAGNAVLKSGLAGHVLTLVLAHPPVNALGYALRCQLADALEKAFADPTIRAIVIGGGDALFSAGADVAEFGSPSAFRTPNLTSLIAMLDAAPKPVIAALTGNAIGGGGNPARKRRPSIR